MEHSVTVTALCEAVGMSRQNFYRQRRRRRRRQIEEEVVVELVQAERQLQPELGGRKLLRRIGPGLREAGIEIGRDRFFELLGRRNLLIKRAKRGKKTTESRHFFRVYTNQFKDLELTGAAPSLGGRFDLLKDVGRFLVSVTDLGCIYAQDYRL